jgi:hypothetical protein
MTWTKWKYIKYVPISGAGADHINCMAFHRNMPFYLSALFSQFLNITHTVDVFSEKAVTELIK